MAEQALKNSSIIILEDLEQAVKISNQYAPEHLIIQTENPRRWLDKINCAGSVFLGPWSP